MNKAMVWTGLVLACLACMAGGAAEAAVVGGAVTTPDRTFELISPPAQVGSNNHNVHTLFAFNERQSVLLTSPLTVNVGPGGSGPVTIPAGTWVSSHYVFYDPPLAAGQLVEGTVDFGAEVLGIITERDDLIASDFLGVAGTSYNSPSQRGLEDDDEATLIGAQQIAVTFLAGSPGDYIRVITIPAPTPLALIAAAAIAAGFRRRGR